MATTTTTKSTKAAKAASTAKGITWLCGDKGVTELKSYESHDQQRGVYSLTLLASCKGRTYQMRLLMNNSTPCGFNSHRCVSVLGDGWRSLVDDVMLNMAEAHSAYEPLATIRAYARRLFAAFEEYVSYL